MKRVLLSVVVVLLAMAAFVVLPQAISGAKYTELGPQVVYSSEGTEVRIYSSEVEDTLRLMVISDTHLWLSDEREDPYRKYSDRMSHAYNTTRHYKTGEETNPEREFVRAMQVAKRRGADAVALLGDMVSYPSERGVEWLCHVLDTTAIPYYYTCGNHDWHYEGMEGTRQELRAKWRKERLTPLFGEHEQDAYGVEIKGVRLFFVDHSTYEILPEQLSAALSEVKSGKPFVVFQHIPFYAMGRPVGYGIGHPEWGAKSDNGYEIERRERWAEDGHRQIDYQFYDAVTTAPNLLASFAGHVHTFGVDIIHSRPHYTVGANAMGGYYFVTIMPLKR